MKKSLFIFLILLLVFLLAYFLWPPKKDSLQVISSVKVQKGVVRQVLEATGIIKSQVGGIVKIGAQATGLIKQMKVKVGDLVKKGELIALIDQRKIIAQIKEARAKVRQAEIELKRINTTYPLKIKQKEKNISIAKNELVFLSNKLERYNKLFKQELIAKEELEQYERDLKNKQEEVKKLLLEKQEIEKEFKYLQEKSKQSLAEAKSRLKVLLTEKSFTEIYSPLTGYVSQVTAQEGETIVAGLQVANLITILDPTKLEMRIYIDETDIGQIIPGQKVTFSVDAYPNKTFTGNIKKIYPEPEIRDNIVYYLALVPLSLQEATYLKPDMTTHCQIEIGKKENVLIIPNSAIKWIKGKEIVFKKEGESFSPIDVNFGLRGFEYTEVTSNLKEGDIVATQVVSNDIKD